MRNLKKILALVLALVMSMSVMSVASADFKDQAAIDETGYESSVDILSALEVFKGYENGNFNPNGSITRAEVAAIIYRIDTKDIGDTQKSIYADYNRFTDVASTAWYAGYVNYCANAQYVKGVSDTEFNPTGYVTGYQVLAMILRVVGYDQNNEFSGSAWQIEVASTAQQLGITKNITAETLGAPATRALVAELLWRALNVPQVTYTLAFGYNQYQELVDRKTPNLTIEQEKIGLATKTLADDEWGRPGATQLVATKWWAKEKVLKTMPVNPLNEDTFEAMDECTIASLMGLKEEKNVDIYYNGAKSLVEVEPLNTNHNNKNHVIGEQGTKIEIYKDRIVMIDTYLAYVVDTQVEKTDKAGHIKQYAYNYIDVYVDEDTTLTFAVEGNNYVDGEYLLVYVNDATLERAYNAKANGTYYDEVSLYDIGTPDELVGKQTKIWWNAEKHTVEGNAYMDNVNYVLDAAQYDKTEEYCWFFDANGNVIGSVVIEEEEVAKKYAVVLGAQWITVVGDNGYAYGTIQYLDGSEPVGVTIAKVNGKVMEYASTINADFANGKVCTTWQYNVDTEKHLYEVKETANGVELTPVVPELTTATLLDGVSKLGTVDGKDIFTDNETLYFFYNKGKLDVVKGYDSLEKYNKGTAIGADIVYNKNGFAAQFVYIPEFVPADAPSAKPVEGEGYYYITGAAYSLDLGEFFALINVVDVKGNTDALLFAKDFAGTEEDGEMYLELLADNCQDMLIHVKTVNGKVVNVDDIYVVGKVDVCEGCKVVVENLTADEYEFIKTGVLKVKTGDEVRVALNVNETTTIINMDGVGTRDDLQNLDGESLYVVYAGTTAVAIFIIPNN